MTYTRTSRLDSWGTAPPEAITAFARLQAPGGLSWVRQHQADRIRMYLKDAAGQPQDPATLPLMPVPDDIGDIIVEASRRWSHLTVAGRQVIVNHDLVTAGIGHESAWLQSVIYRLKCNPMGYGAENRDPVGLAHTFASLEEAIDMYVRHLLGYMYGDGPWRSTRFHLLGSNAGTVTEVWHLEQRYAWSENYASIPVEQRYGSRLAAHATTLLAFVAAGDWKEHPMTLHVALSAGHHNTAGGNPEEIKTVGPLTTELARQLRAAGVRVSQITPDSGVFPGDHNAVARAVRDLDLRDRVDLFWECHTEGTSNPANCGSFGVTPFWPRDNPTDRDRDAERISADLAKRLEAATGISVKQTNTIAPGVMAEYQTGVGKQGAGTRLGVFLNTASARGHMTRCIYEYGAHTCPHDLAIQRQPWFSERAARATVEAIAAYYGVQAEQPGGGGGSTPRPAEVSDPGARYFPETGCWIQWGFKGYWEANPNGLMDYGYPLTNEVIEEGMAVQYFERAVFEWHADIERVLLRRLGAAALEQRAA